MTKDNARKDREEGLCNMKVNCNRMVRCVEGDMCRPFHCPGCGRKMGYTRWKEFNPEDPRYNIRERCFGCSNINILD